jgi:hypothetical protein
MKLMKILFEYEPIKLEYTQYHHYIPDFRLPNGIIIEAKGKLDQSTRSKMLAVKRTYPDLDIRFVFMRAGNTLDKNSKMTYGQWATKNGFIWADQRIPEEWFEE